MKRGDNEAHSVVEVRKDFHGMLDNRCGWATVCNQRRDRTVEHSNGTPPTIPHVDVEATELEARMFGIALLDTSSAKECRR